MTRATWADTAKTWADATATWAYAGVTDLNPTFEWSPTTDPGETAVWEDITELVRSGTISRGRQSEFDRTSAGKLTLEVDNRAQTFDPDANSNARPNKRVRVSVGIGADVVRLFDGFIDAIPQVWDPPNDAITRLTATDGFKLLARHELDAIYGPIIDADGPWVWWRLADDLPLALTAVDSSGNGNDGAIKGAPSSTQSLLTDGPGAMSFGGSADPGEGSTDGVIGTATIATVPLSVEAWVRTGKYGTNVSFICGQTHTVGSAGFIIDAGFSMNNSTSVPGFECQVGGINVTLSAPAVIMRDTGPHHLVGTVDSSRNARFYVDGVLVAGPTATGSTTTVDASGSVRVAKTPVAADPGSGSSYKSFKGDVCEFAFYERALSAAEILEHYTAGAAPWANETTGARVARILNLVGWPSGERDVETGASTLGAATGIEGRTALDHLLAVEQTEQGRVFMRGDGYAAFYSRNHAVGTAEASFDEDDYTDLVFDYSDANLANDVTVTRVGGLPQRAQDAASIAAYWRASESISQVLYATDNEALAMAEWRVDNYSQPVLRPTSLEFVPLKDLPDLFPRVLSRELGDRVSVSRTLGGRTVTIDAVIEGIQHRFAPPRDWVTSWNLAPLTYGQFGPGGGSGLLYLKLNDATLGRLDNGNRLGF